MARKRPRASFRLLEDTLNHLKNGVARYDENERLVICNETYAGFFGPIELKLAPGISAEEIASAALLSNRAELRAEYTDYRRFDLDLAEFRAASGQPHLRITHDGRRCSVAYSRTEDGGTIAICTDVTERQEYRLALDTGEENLWKVLETVSEGVIGIDEQGIIDSYNSAAKRIFGYQADEVIGRNVSMLMPETDAVAHDDYIRRYLETGEARIIGIGREVVGRRKSGETFPMALAIEKMETSRNVRFVGTIRDLSRTREIETQLRHSEKMRAIGQLTGGIAHDFNNLLTVILGNLRALENTDGLPAATSTSIAAALRATKQAGDLTRRLLDFSRRTPWEPKLVNPGAAVDDVIEMITPILGRRIALHANIARDIGEIRVDPAQLQNALINLAINSRDAMSGAGSLTFTVRRASRDELERSASVLSNIYDVVVLEVEDDGQGMTPDVVERAVEPFFTTKGIDEGSGLGLSMVYRFVEQSGGDIQIESKPSVGTAVRLLLPAACADTSDSTNES